MYHPVEFLSHTVSHIAHAPTHPYSHSYSHSHSSRAWTRLRLRRMDRTYVRSNMNPIQSRTHTHTIHTYNCTQAWATGRIRTTADGCWAVAAEKSSFLPFVVYHTIYTYKIRLPPLTYTLKHPGAHIQCTIQHTHTQTGMCARSCVLVCAYVCKHEHSETNERRRQTENNNTHFFHTYDRRMHNSLRSPLESSAL